MLVCRGIQVRNNPTKLATVMIGGYFWAVTYPIHYTIYKFTTKFVIIPSLKYMGIQIMNKIKVNL
jgi:hypothetical protein